MKTIIALSLVLFSSLTSAKEMRDFNKILINGVQKDLDTQNDQRFKTKEARRGPASVEADVEGSQIEETQKVEKSNFRQIGPNKW